MSEEEKNTSTEEAAESEVAEEAVVPADFVYSKEKLIENAKTLNKVVYPGEDGKDVELIKTKVRVVAIKEAALKLAFIEACESVPEALEVHLPDECGVMYNYLVAEETAGENTAGTNTEAPAAAPAEGSGKTGKKKDKDKKKDKAPATTGGETKEKRKPPVREKDAYGNVKGTMSSAINEMIDKGSKEEAIVDKLVKDFGRTKEKAAAKVKSHKGYLESVGFPVTEEGGIVRFAKKK